MSEITAKMLQDAAFIVSFSEFQQDAAAVNKQKGFDSPDRLCDRLEGFVKTKITPTDVEQDFAQLFAAFRNARAGLKLMLITGEIGEALEAVRKNMGPDEHIPAFTAEEAETADAIIRLMNYATDRRLRLAEAIVAKNEFNRTRSDHSKDARESEHGKRF